MWGRQGDPPEKEFMNTNCRSPNPRKPELPQSLNTLLRRVNQLGTFNFLCWNGVPSSITLPNLNIYRKMREKWWMWNIGAIHPIGINQFI